MLHKLMLPKFYRPLGKRVPPHIDRSGQSLPDSMDLWDDGNLNRTPSIE